MKYVMGAAGSVWQIIMVYLLYAVPPFFLDVVSWVPKLLTELWYSALGKTGSWKF